jgi:DNA-binding GntR family transcriptional regulator
MQDREQLSKTDAAYRLLRRDILSTKLKPGAPLKLSALRDAYGVGWTPLREALSRLEAERLVTAISNRGFTVAPVSREALEDLTRARLVIVGSAPAGVDRKGRQRMGVCRRYRPLSPVPLQIHARRRVGRGDR